jgi:hypothetical protein
MLGASGAEKSIVARSEIVERSRELHCPSPIIRAREMKRVVADFEEQSEHIGTADDREHAIRRSKRGGIPQRTRMKLRIHRGTREMGGTCVELESAGSRILLDLGLPLNADGPDSVSLD